MLAKTKLWLEDYQSFLENPCCKEINNQQLNQIIQMHGFKRLYKHPKKQVLDALSTINPIMPGRSTLNETILPSGTSMTIDEVNKDIDALEWQECPVQSIETLNGFGTVIDGGGYGSLKEMPAAVNFNIPVKKPRSKRQRKTRSVNEIIAGGGAGGDGGVGCGDGDGDCEGEGEGDFDHVFDDLSPLRETQLSEPLIGFW